MIGASSIGSRAGMRKAQTNARYEVDSQRQAWAAQKAKEVGIVKEAPLMMCKEDETREQMAQQIMNVRPLRVRLVPYSSSIASISTVRPSGI
jgi:hypothetical protein